MKKQTFKISTLTIILSLFILSIPVSVFAYGLSTYEATNITDTGVTFNGSFSIDNEDKSVPTWFEYSYMHYVDDDVSRGVTPKEDHRTGNFSKSFDGLFPNTHYWYRACFHRTDDNCQQGYNKEFRTLPAVTLAVNTTKDALNISGVSATLKGSWTSNSSSTYAYAWFQYGTDPSLATFSSTEVLHYYNGSSSISQKLTGLNLNTLYYFRLVVKNKAGTSYGQINSFRTLTTLAPPYALFNENANPSVATVTTCGTTPTKTTLPAICNGNRTNNISDTEATLRGTATPDITPTIAYFRYSDMEVPPVFCNDIYGSKMISTEDNKNIIADGGQQSFNQEISDLKESTTYYYCAVVSDKNQVTYGDVKEFTTLPCPTCAQTTITTNPATVAGQNSAWLKGSYSSTIPITTYFEYATDTSNQINIGGNPQAKEFWAKINSSVQSHHSNSYGDVSFLLSGLTAKTKYKFRLIGETTKLPTKITNGEILKFTTKTNNNGTGLEFVPDQNPTTYGNSINENGASNQTTNTVSGTNGNNLTLNQYAIPPVDAIVRYHEGIEIVLVRQIMANPELAKRYGYVEGANLENFAWSLADLFAKIFGYVGENGKEIRVTVPDMAAYQVLIVDNKLTIYEYFNNRIVNIQSMTESLRNTYEYEYYFRK